MLLTLRLGSSPLSKVTYCKPRLNFFTEIDFQTTGLRHQALGPICG